MREALLALNAIVAEGLIESYAIGGAIGASYYIEAAATEDLDIFAVLPTTDGGILSLSAIYAACTARGAVIDDAYIRFGPWPVQILPAYKPLVEEALANAIDVEFDGIPTRVFTPEYVCAIAIDTNRNKDYLRVAMFLEEDAVDIVQLETLLQRYNLTVPRDRIPNWPSPNANPSDTPVP